MSERKRKMRFTKACLSHDSPTKSPTSPRFNAHNELLAVAPSSLPSQHDQFSRKGSLISLVKRKRPISGLWGTPNEDTTSILDKDSPGPLDAHQFLISEFGKQQITSSPNAGKPLPPLRKESLPSAAHVHRAPQPLQMPPQRSPAPRPPQPPLRKASAPETTGIDLHIRSFSHVRSLSGSHHAPPPPIIVPTLHRAPLAVSSQPQNASLPTIQGPLISNSLRKLASDPALPAARLNTNLSLSPLPAPSARRASTNTSSSVYSSKSHESALAAEVREGERMSVLRSTRTFSVYRRSNPRCDVEQLPQPELEHQTFPKSAGPDTRRSEEQARPVGEDEGIDLDDMPFLSPPRNVHAAPTDQVADFLVSAHQPETEDRLDPPAADEVVGYRFPAPNNDTHAIETLSDNEPGSSTSSVRYSSDSSQTSLFSYSSNSALLASEYQAKKGRSASLTQGPLLRSSSLASATSVDSGYASYPIYAGRSHIKSSSHSSMGSEAPFRPISPMEHLAQSAAFKPPSRPPSRSSVRMATLDMALPPPEAPPFPWQIVPLSDVKTSISNDDLQKLVLSSMRELGMQEMGLIKSGAEGLLKEIQVRTDEVDVLQERYATETQQRNALLKRHLMVLGALNGEEGGRFADSLLTAVRRVDRMAQEVCSTTAHIGKVAAARATHYNAAAALSLSKLNGSYLRSKEKSAKLQDKLTQALMERDAAREQARALEKELDQLKRSIMAPKKADDDDRQEVVEDSDHSTLPLVPRRRRGSTRMNQVPFMHHAKSASTPPEVGTGFANLGAELEDAMRRDEQAHRSPLLGKPEFSKSESSIADALCRDDDDVVPPRRQHLRPLHLAHYRSRSGSLPSISSFDDFAGLPPRRPACARPVDAVPLHRTHSIIAMGTSLDAVADLVDSYKS